MENLDYFTLGEEKAEVESEIESARTDLKT